MIMHTFRTDSRGVTLVEMLLVVGLLSIFLALVSTIFAATVDTQNQTTRFSATVADGRFIMSRLEFDIARASAIVIPATLSASCSTSLQLTVGTTYAYALSGSNLQLNQNDGNGAINLNGGDTKVSNPCFQRIGNAGGKDTIRYSFTISAANAGNGTDTQTFTSTVERR